MLDALFSETRQSILKLFLMRPEARFHLREVARQTGKPVGTIQPELASLLNAQILTKAISGNRTYYQANTTCPIYPELRGLILKTIGLGDVLRDTLAPLATKIKAAFVYGSMASGETGPQSDVDLIVVGDVDEMALHRAVGGAEQKLGRAVNYTLLSWREFQERCEEKAGFLARVLGGPKITILGCVNEI
ncbi:MAG: nucleotidyltransferase domain-containing protein [Planctomycetia bacterium]|nr:nucleotidyltransferase domain-containing protein [Planctomycetia bacterium]